MDELKMWAEKQIAVWTLQIESLTGGNIGLRNWMATPGPT